MTHYHSLSSQIVEGVLVLHSPQTAVHCSVMFFSETSCYAFMTLLGSKRKESSSSAETEKDERSEERKRQEVVRIFLSMIRAPVSRTLCNSLSFVAVWNWNQKKKTWAKRLKRSHEGVWKNCVLGGVNFHSAF